MKVIVADKISDRGIELLKQTNWNIVPYQQRQSERGTCDADALMYAAPRRSHRRCSITRRGCASWDAPGVGVDNIDLDEATKRGDSGDEARRAEARERC